MNIDGNRFGVVYFTAPVTFCGRSMQSIGAGEASFSLFAGSMLAISPRGGGAAILVPMASIERVELLQAGAERPVAKPTLVAVPRPAAQPITAPEPASPPARDELVRRTVGGKEVLFNTRTGVFSPIDPTPPPPQDEFFLDPLGRPGKRPAQAKTTRPAAPARNGLAVAVAAGPHTDKDRRVAQLKAELLELETSQPAAIVEQPPPPPANANGQGIPREISRDGLIYDRLLGQFRKEHPTPPVDLGPEFPANGRGAQTATTYSPPPTITAATPPPIVFEEEVAAAKDYEIAELKEMVKQLMTQQAQQAQPPPTPKWGKR
jgi:hypothetical protein